MPEQPPYLRVADQFRRRISEGDWRPGDQLPGRAQLGDEYGVGRNVIRRAEELLISEGLLEGRWGAGTYVAEPKDRLRLVRSRSNGQPSGSPFGHDADDVEGHMTWESRTVAKAPMPADIATRLRRDEGGLGVRTEYEVLVNGRPGMVATSWEPYGLTAGTIVVLPEAGPLAGRGIVERMAEIGVTVAKVEERPEPRQATPEEATLLGVQRGAQVLHIRRTHFSDEGNAVETADIIVPAARCEIVYELPVT